LNCIKCNAEIPTKRLEILPNTKVCVQCSEVNRVAGHPLITSKTSYSELQIVSQEVAKELFEKQDRKGSIASGVQFRQLPPPKLSNFE
jgi:hypothetical protein